MAEYRIVTDRFAGFEVQARRWWFPIWLQCNRTGGTNSHGSIERAEAFAEQHAKGCGGRFVKYLGKLTASPRT